MDERVSIRRFRSEAVGDCPAETVVRLMRELGPEGGDFVVLRATPGRAEAIERNLVAQLFTQGAHVAGEPVGATFPCEGCDTPLPVKQPPDFYCPSCGLEQGRLGT